MPRFYLLHCYPMSCMSCKECFKLKSAADRQLPKPNPEKAVCPQYLWFRHTFVLTAGQAAELRGLAVAALADRKLEVGELAASTLSGMLKVRFS